MTIDLDRETEKLITDKGRYHILRQNIEAANLPLLDEEAIGQEVAERRGSLA